MERAGMHVCKCFAPPVHTHTMGDQGIKVFNEDLLEGVLFVHISTTKGFCRGFISILGRRYVFWSREVRNIGFRFRYDLIGCILLQQEDIYLKVGVKLPRFTSGRWAVFLVHSFRPKKCL